MFQRVIVQNCFIPVILLIPKSVKVRYIEIFFFNFLSQKDIIPKFFAPKGYYSEKSFFRNLNIKIDRITIFRNDNLFGEKTFHNSDRWIWTQQTLSEWTKKFGVTISLQPTTFRTMIQHTRLLDHLKLFKFLS